MKPNTALMNKFSLPKAGSFLCGEVFFALFIIAGTFKSIMPLQDHIDLTLLFMILSMISALCRFIKRPAIRKDGVLAIILYTILFMVVTFSLLYTPSSIYSKDKTIKLIGLIGWIVTGTVLLINNDRSLLKFLNTITIVSIIMSIDALMLYTKINTLTFIQPSSTSYLTFSRLNATAFITLLCFYILSVKNKFYLILLGVLSLIMITVTVTTGAKSTLLSLILCLLVLFLVSIRVKTKAIFIYSWAKRYVSISFILIIVFIVLLGVGYFNLVIDRFEMLLGGYDNSRFILAKHAYDMWKEKPILGWGVGSYTVISFGEDYENYPHNIILELLSENGILGAIPFITLCWLSISRCYKSYRSNNISNYYAQLTLLVQLFFWLSMIFFSSLNSARLMHVFIVLGIMSPLRSYNEKKFN